jgi:hypothetical protein
MKNLYCWCWKTACITVVLITGNITGLNVVAQTPPDLTQTNYTPVYVGKIIPNNNTYTDNRQKTRFVNDAADNYMKLPEPAVMSDLSATPGNGGVELRWRTNREPGNLKLYEIEYSENGITFQQAGVIAAGNYLNGKAYVFRHFPVNVRDRIFYRIRMVDKNGRYDFTRIIPVAASGTTSNYVFPTIVNTGNVSLYLNDSFRLVQIINMQGRILQTQLLNGRTGRIDINLSPLAEGICIVRVVSNDPQRSIVQRIFIR